jgi:hypothetical protein
MNETHHTAYTQIRLYLETRLARVLNIERNALPVMSLSEIVNLLFCHVWAQQLSRGIW